MWSLLPVDLLRNGPGGGKRTTFQDAVVLNHLSILGDQMIGTLPSLGCVITADPRKDRSVGEDGRVGYTIGAVDFFIDGRPVTTDNGGAVVRFLMLFGSWEVSETPIIEDGELIKLEYIARPPEDTGQGFEIIGSLSSMYSRMFETYTRGPQGVTALDMRIVPGSMISLIPHDYSSDDVPLWRFELAPRADENNAPGDELKTQG
jgi:hypothetical protein